MNKEGQMTRVTLWAIMVIATLFLFSELFDNTFPYQAATISGIMSQVRTPLMIIQFLAVAILFVDLVVRYDKLNEKFQIAHVVAVGYCIISFMFQIFVYYMDSAFLAESGLSLGLVWA